MLKTVHQAVGNLILQLLVTRIMESAVKMVSINGVTSCYLSGLVFNVSVSFLLDIGAGVSVMNGRVLDRIKLNDINIDTTECHKLIGVRSCNPLR